MFRRSLGIVISQVLAPSRLLPAETIPPGPPQPVPFSATIVFLTVYEPTLSKIPPTELLALFWAIVVSLIVPGAPSWKIAPPPLLAPEVTVSELAQKVSFT